jgi:hypothetical protein
MEAQAGIYTLEITLVNGERVFKVGYADNMSEKFRNRTFQPQFVYYIDNETMAKKMVNKINSDFKHAEVVPGYYPLRYKIIVEIRFTKLEEELKQLYSRKSKIKV